MMHTFYLSKQGRYWLGWLMLASLTLQTLPGQAQTFSVTNTGDTGTGSLRTAMLNVAASTSPGPFTITAGISGTINLGSALPDVTKDIAFLGPGASKLTIHRSTGGNYRIFYIHGTNTVRFDGFTMADGFANQSDGGAINNGSILSVSNCIFRNNQGTGNGGAIFSLNRLTVTNCLFTGNAGSLGGGLYHIGSLLAVTNSTFTGNTGSEGGGLTTDGSNATITSCLFSGNSAGYGGGAEDTGNGLFVNCTFSNNTATSAGGGVSLAFGSASTFINSTFTLNKTKGTSGGIANIGGSTPLLKNCIIAGNTNTADTAADDISDGPVNNSSSFNIIGTGGSGGLLHGTNSNQVGLAGIRLAALGTYGGPVQTHPLLPGSPAINAGTATGAPLTDARGIGRVGTPDAGSFESRGFTLTPASGDNQSAVVNTAFASPLRTTVSSANGEPVDGGFVSYAAPLAGASATPTSATVAIVGSVASATLTANATTGAYSVSAGVAGTSPVLFSLTNTFVVPATIAVTGLAASLGTVCVGSPVTFTATVGNITGSYAYTLTTGTPTGTISGTTGSALFSQTLTAGDAGVQLVTLTIAAAGKVATGTTGLTVGSFPIISIGGTLTVTTGGSTTLTALETSGVSGTTYTWSTRQTSPSISATAGTYSLTVATAGGCASTTTATVITRVTAGTANSAPVPSANASQTATVGQAFSFTASAFTDLQTPNSLTYSASISPANGLTLTPATRIVSGTPLSTGVSSVTITATDPGGLSASTTFTVTVGPATTGTATQLIVLQRDPDNGQLSTNTIKPYLQIQNTGSSAVPYGEITVRYWLTVENPVPLLFSINYAQMGNDKVRLAYVPVSPLRQGATGYVEYRFDTSAGTLAGGSNAVIQDLINKQDYSSFFQGDDYSYVNNANFTANPRITAYRNGVLIYGVEPVVIQGNSSVINTTPTATTNTSPVATVGVSFSYTASAFTDTQTPNSLTYTASINPANGLTFNPATRLISGTPLSTGVSSVTITATDPGGLSASTTFTVTVGPATIGTATQLIVLQRDPDNGQLSTNTIKPYLQIQNTGSSAVPYGEITVRYWLTIENPTPLLFSINYAQPGSDKVHLSYLPVSPLRQGATGYVEYRFDASAGSLAANTNSGPIQTLINKQDYSYVNQGDDYSYINNANFTANPHITAYRNGMLIYGVEPVTGGRLAAKEAETDVSLQVRVLGNPIQGEELMVEIRGAAGQPLHVRVTDLTGHLLSEQLVDRADLVEQQRLRLANQPAGLLLLQVSTPAQTRTVTIMTVR